MTPIQSSNSSANKIAVYRLHFDYIFFGNGTQAVLRAGYKTKHPAEIAYELLRNTKVKHALHDAQNARSQRLQMRVDSTV